MFIRIRKLVMQYFADSRWYTIAIATLFYGCSSWFLLFLAGESALTSHIDFIYWLAVTTSTVGYGDFSPTTNAGKIIVAFYVIPFGLTIFAMIIGRIAGWITNQWRKGVMGLKKLNVKNHILVIGWNENRTIQLLNILLTEKEALADKPEIVLCVRVDITNPMPGKIEFVKVNTFNKDEDMDAACTASARTIIIDNPLDDLTMTTALYCSQRNPDAHKVAYFNDESLVGLLQKHCPNVECTPSVAVEMIAKSAIDPGSSSLHHGLLHYEHGDQTQFSVEVPELSSPLLVEQVFKNLKAQYDAILIGVAPLGIYKNMQVNPPMTMSINSGDKLFYIAKSRIHQVNWLTLGTEHV